ncbi:hypothetical protein AK830_g2235 [Neonectria ditissima]|uniref:Protein kinase domain-containing protein n=1 Tax=Neonectria ditissima TaxID=78410 RepID=A0A0P7BWQ2_9HYPO|nr:hypothetical protein AK830_g2235 [Neonectria ditissima]
MSGLECIPAVVDICLRLGKGVFSKMKVLKDADDRLRALEIRASMTWDAIEKLLNIVKGLRGLIEEKDAQNQIELLHRLQHLMRHIDSKLKKLKLPDAPVPSSTKTSAAALRYAFKENGLERDLAGIHDWLACYGQPWLSIMIDPSDAVDQQLAAAAADNDQDGDVQEETASLIRAAKHLRKALKSDPEKTVFLDPKGLDISSIRPVPFSPVSLAYRASKNEMVLLDPATCKAFLHMEEVMEDIRSFAIKLRHADPFVLGLLDCKAVLKADIDPSSSKQDASVDTKVSLDPHGRSFIFRIPESHTKIESVRARLLNGPLDKHASFSQRLNLARQLVNAVSSVHLYRFVHKNIRPETILVLASGDQKRAKPLLTAGNNNVQEEAAVLVGFDVLRNAGGATRRVIDNSWEKDIYRHTSRQGPAPDGNYEMRHDIYSVGVCMLEIGLWDSFVAYPVPHGPAQHGPGLEMDNVDEASPWRLRDPRHMKEHFLQLARGGRLEQEMGQKYCDIVETCLTCLDEGNVDFGHGKEFQDDHGILVKSTYIKKVWVQLCEIAV